MRVRWTLNGKIIGSVRFKNSNDCASSLFTHLLIEQYKKGYDIVGRLNRPQNKIVLMSDKTNVWGVQLCQSM